MKREYHLDVDDLVFGREYPEVHRWLDECAGHYFRIELPYGHWTERHYLEAIQKEFAGVALEVAKMHILCDWASHFGTMLLPETKQEVIDKLKEWGGIPQDTKFVGV